MSVRVMSLVWQIDLADSEKIVLLALADSANDEGVCWPSMATLARKCSKSDRTVQASIKKLVDGGHLSRHENPGKGCNYTVHPRSGFAPEETAPPKPAQQPPTPVRGTPEAASDKPSKNHQEPSPINPRDHELPDDWEPQPFGETTQSRKIVDGWPPGEFECQVEQFRAHHGKKRDKFSDWQKAWATWALNTRKFGIGRQNERGSNGMGGSGANPGLGRTTAAAINVIARLERAKAA